MHEKERAFAYVSSERVADDRAAPDESGVGVSRVAPDCTHAIIDIAIIVVMLSVFVYGLRLVRITRR